MPRLPRPRCQVRGTGYLLRLQRRYLDHVSLDSFLEISTHTNKIDSYDVTYKNASKVISRTSYEGASYTHQGWVLDKTWQTYLLLDDEVDEEDGAGPAADGYPVTYIVSSSLF